ncbi:cadherin-17 isoform X2 [Gopherus flavomarginatus]|uniref:cadherin-17 isoform X2 n=1 Tax=Gopherus flavomarginatus TaxID=286002 RepID=UPI0021CC0D8A|nr:cadherin-17 isoform X2 [Gopherus flavomarginatus]
MTCTMDILKAACHGMNGLGVSGPLQDMTFSVSEGTTGVHVIYQFTIEPPAVSLRLSGEKDDVIEIASTDGYLYLNGSLDRENKAIHRLQVEALNVMGEKVKGPYSITINVQDINDNPPKFEKSKYYGAVWQNSHPGKPFLRVHATDRDDPTTPNAKLSYNILHHFPNPFKSMLFQIDNVTGAISTSELGSRLLNPQKQATFILVVTVKDLAGMSENALTSNIDVEITVKENIWKAPPKVSIKENSTEPHPISITQVQWNEPDAKYDLLQGEWLPRFPFTIDQNGTIYVTEPLDREEKELYSFFATAKDNEGEELGRPLLILVQVEDINDNPPVCQNALTIFEVQENEGLGSNIGTLHATDMDKKNTLNSRLQFRIVDQNPKIPLDSLFIIQQEAGTFQLSSSSLNKQVASTYSVMVEVTDKVFTTLCDVKINVIDINDQIPIFEKSDYGNCTILEDTPEGEVILEIQATDADEPFTGSSQIIYQIEEGDQNKNFIIETDPQTNRGFVKISKALDFEMSSTYNLTVKATNPEPLVKGVRYNSSSTAYFRVVVVDANEGPVFSKNTYIADIFEDVPVGTLVMTMTANDPEGDQIRYTLKNNKRNWLEIDTVSGKIYTAAPLDREVEHDYRVQVTATEENKKSQSSTAIFIMHIKDVNDNPPRLAKGNHLFFCHPLRGEVKAEIQATDDDEQLYPPEFTFSLGGGENIKSDWEISRIDGTHAYLSPKHTNLEEKQYSIPLIINDNGKPPLEGDLNLQVNVCRCSDEGRCFIEVENHSGMPSTGMAVGLLLGVLLFIGLVVGGVFLRMKNKTRKELNKNAPKPSELKTLT